MSNPALPCSVCRTRPRLPGEACCAACARDAAHDAPLIDVLLDPGPEAPRRITLARPAFTAVRQLADRRGWRNPSGDDRTWIRED